MVKYIDYKTSWEEGRFFHERRKKCAGFLCFIAGVFVRRQEP